MRAPGLSAGRANISRRDSARESFSIESTYPSSSSTTSSSALSHRPAWNNTPLRNTPAYLKGLRILTDEPWKEVSVADMAARMNFGSRESLGLTDDDELFEYNGLVEEARNTRRADDNITVGVLLLRPVEPDMSPGQRPKLQLMRRGASFPSSLLQAASSASVPSSPFIHA